MVKKTRLKAQTAPAAAPKPDSEKVSRGREHHRAGRLAHAKTLYLSAIAADPQDGEARHLLGLIAQQEGDPATGVRLIQEALDIHKTAAAYSNLGHVLQSLGRSEEAEAACRAAIEIDPAFVNAYQNLGDTLHAAGRLDAAVRAFKAGLARERGHEALALNLAVTLCELGRFNESLTVLDNMLLRNGRHAQAHFNRGNALFQLGRAPEAADAFVRATAIEPRLRDAHFNRAAALQSLEQFGEAANAYRAALAVDPVHQPSLTALSNALGEAGAFDEAVVIHERLLALRPDDVEVLHALGAAELNGQHHAKAAETFRRVTAMRPDLFSPWANLATALRAQGDLLKAADAYRNAAAVDPEPASSLSKLAGVLVEAGRLQDGVDAGIRALQHDPDCVEALINMGVAKLEQGRFAEAVDALDRALVLRPEDPLALCNLGVARYRQGRVTDAIDAYELALLTNDSTTLRYNYSYALLKLGRFAAGWRNFEHRFDASGPVKIAHTDRDRLWRGQPFEGQTLLLHGEQGFGDAIQCLRYASMAAARGGRVVLQVRPPIQSLCKGLPGVSDVTDLDLSTAFDWHCPLFNLPSVFDADLETIPGEPYLKADPDRAADWTKRLRGSSFRIGLVWQGNPAGSVERGRSIPIAAFAPVAGVKGVELVSLQKEHGLDQLETLPEGMVVRTLGGEYEIGDFGVTAAVIMALDLVICCDTAVAHLAGALGKPVWLLTNAVSDWRWLEDRRDSPWYPSMRIYRQHRTGDWTAVLDEVAMDLATLVAARAGE